MKSNGMVERLDINKIVQGVYTELEPLYKELGVIGSKESMWNKFGNSIALFNFIFYNNSADSNKTAVKIMYIYPKR